MARKYHLKAAGYDFDKLVDRISNFFQLNPAEILLPSKQRHRLKVRSLLCFWTTKELGMSNISVAKRLGQRGEKLAIENNFFL